MLSPQGGEALNKQNKTNKKRICPHTEIFCRNLNPEEKEKYCKTS